MISRKKKNKKKQNRNDGARVRPATTKSVHLEHEMDTLVRHQFDFIFFFYFV